MKKILILFILTIPMVSKAQLDIGTFLEAGASDAEKLMEAYFEPVFQGVGYGINSGWYSTAKPHKLLGFDITATATLAMVPTDAEFFDINGLGLQNAEVVRNFNGDILSSAPTILGPNVPNEQLPLIRYYDDNGDRILDFSAPTGLGMEEFLDENSPFSFNAMPTAMAQIGIGLVKNTDVIIRILPEQGSDGEFKFNMFGLGFKHDIKQWIPVLKLSPFDFSAFAGWNKINTTIFLDEDAPDQAAEFSTSGFTVQGIVSKKIAVLTPFVGIGFATTATNFSLLGDYDVEGGRLTDPINFKYTSGGPRINLGAQLRLFFINLHVDYAIQKYNTLTIGAGIGIR